MPGAWDPIHSRQIQAIVDYNQIYETYDVRLPNSTKYPKVTTYRSCPATSTHLVRETITLDTAGRPSCTSDKEYNACGKIGQAEQTKLLGNN